VDEEGWCKRAHDHSVELEPSNLNAILRKEGIESGFCGKVGLFMKSRFYYSVCQFGAEKAVKDEVIASYPGLKFAFSRPGFITFKEDSDTGPELGWPASIFTRLWGVSIGQGKTVSTREDLLDAIPDGAVIHAFERDTFLPGDEPEGFRPGNRVQLMLKTAKKHLVIEGRKPEPGEWVYDLVWLDEEHLFLGKHRHEDGLDPAPGNQPVIALPANSPSRAYLKIAEAVHRFSPEIRKGLPVLEVGCSPGGATTFMLSQGMTVTGVDPKSMDPQLSKKAGFQFIQREAKALIKDDVKNLNPEWLVLDMNLAPLEALDEVAHVIRLLRESQGKKLQLRAGFLTIKLNDWKFASSTPLYLKRIRELGFERLTAIQLCSNRQEFFVYAEGFR